MKVARGTKWANVPRVHLGRFGARLVAPHGALARFFCVADRRPRSDLDAGVSVARGSADGPMAGVRAKRSSARDGCTATTSFAEGVVVHQRRCRAAPTSSLLPR